MANRERELLSVLRREFSPYAYISSVSEKESQIGVGIQVQELIADQGEQGTEVKVLQLDDVATISWKPNDRIIRLGNLTRRRLADQARDRYTSIIERSQIALLPTLYKRLVHIPQVVMAMSPLRRILIQISEENAVSGKDLRRSASMDSKIPKYFALLSELEFVKPENSHYVAGWRMKNLQADQVDPAEVYERILGEVIQKRSKYLTQVLHWTMMVPYLQWSNTYYFPAYEAGRLVKIERSDMLSNYKRFYGSRVSSLIATDQVQQVVDVRILAKDNSIYEGIQSVFDDFVTIADREKILEPRIAAR